MSLLITSLQAINKAFREENPNWYQRYRSSRDASKPNTKKIFPESDHQGLERKPYEANLP
jgi:hypothetical protein